MDGGKASTVSGSHVLVQVVDSVSASEFTELLVHVVGTRARVVAKPDTKVLDLERLLLVDLYITNEPHSSGNNAILTTLTDTISPVAFFIFRS